MADIDVSSWWPPKAGDKLRHHTHHSAGDMRIKWVEALLHVLSVFKHEEGDDDLIVTAEWLPGRRRWVYKVWDRLEAEFGAIWRDGEERPVWPTPKPPAETRVTDKLGAT